MRELIKAIQDCLPDLEHYAATHGPGPDKRLQALKTILEGLDRDKADYPWATQKRAGDSVACAMTNAMIAQEMIANQGKPVEIDPLYFYTAIRREA